MPDVELLAKEVLVNLKNYDFDIFGYYKMDHKEADKLIYVLETMLQEKK